VTVQELIKELSTHPGDTLVVLAKDNESNRFSPLAESRMCLYRADTTWSGSIYTDPDDESRDSVKAVVLWPVN
jgi:hypothetical protein